MQRKIMRLPMTFADISFSNEEEIIKTLPQNIGGGNKFETENESAHIFIFLKIFLTQCGIFRGVFSCLSIFHLHTKCHHFL